MRDYQNEPKLIEELIERLTQEYDGIARMETGTRIKFGERNDVFRMEGNGEKWIVRIIHHSTAIAGLEFTNNWSRFAADRMPEAVAPLYTKSGKTYFIHHHQGFEMMVCLYPFIEGEHSSRFNRAHRIDMAKKQARLHQIGLIYPDMTPRPDRKTSLDLDFEDNFLFNWKNVETMLKTGGRAMFEDPHHQNEEDQRCIQGLYDHRQSLLDAHKELGEWAMKTRARKASLQYAPVHGDMYSSNVLARGDKIVGIIDWDECNIDSLAYEFGRTMWEYSKDTDICNFNREHALEYRDAYVEAGGPVPEKDWDLCVPFVRLLKFLDIMLYMNNSIIGDVWGPAYGYESVKVMENLADFKLF